MDDKLRDFMRRQDDYGGMQTEMYDAIVAFKRDGTYPEFAQDRAARTAWKLRCIKYALVHDDETLVYINQNGPQKPRFVVKVGEPVSIIGRVHEMIGHLGTKRTQMAIMRCFYWRSVRADIQRFVENCDHCREKKITGQKLLKAPIDVTKDDCIDVAIRSKEELQGTVESRFIISIEGIDDSVYPLFLNARMTTYTFKETHHRRPVDNAPKIRGRPHTRRKMSSIHHRHPPSKVFIPMGHCLDGHHEIYARRPEYLTQEWVTTAELDRWASQVTGQLPTSSGENLRASMMAKPEYAAERHMDLERLHDDYYDVEATSNVPISIRCRINGVAAKTAEVISRIPDTEIDQAVIDNATLIEDENKMDVDVLAMYCSVTPIY